MKHQFSIVTSIIASSVRGWRGKTAIKAGARPAVLLELYDMEGCPWCRMVRECLTELDLDVVIHSCPKGSTRNRKTLQSIGGSSQVPFLVDPNTGIKLYESQAIIAYLMDSYGNVECAEVSAAHYTSVASAKMATAIRFLSGLRYREAHVASKPLELYSFEASPFCRVVRETLTELEISYVLRNVGKQPPYDVGISKFRKGKYQPKPGSKREAFLAAKNKFQVPFLNDPNTNISMYDSKNIITYLNSTYAI